MVSFIDSGIALDRPKTVFRLDAGWAHQTRNPVDVPEYSESSEGPRLFMLTRAIFSRWMQLVSRRLIVKVVFFAAAVTYLLTLVDLEDVQVRIVSMSLQAFAGALLLVFANFLTTLRRGRFLRVWWQRKMPCHS